VTFRYEIAAPEPKPIRKVLIQGQTSPLPPPAAPMETGGGQRRVIVRATAQNRASRAAVSAGPADSSKPPARWVAR
jgi:hypothetical protein